METAGAGTAIVPPAAPSGAPDWPAITAEILCPLCDYNLRGLAEPRCPECGHGFDWKELLARSTWEHRWLFEHSRSHKIRCLVKTFATSQLPRRFWCSVRPIHPPRALRLVVYCVIVTAVLAAPIAGCRIWKAASYYRMQGLAWQQNAQWIRNNPNDPEVAARVHEFGSMEAFLRAAQPHLLRWNNLRLLLNESSLLVKLLWEIVLGCVLWPWLTLLSLMIFRWSLRKARIKTVHVLRCAIYSSDTAVVLAIPLAILLTVFVRQYTGIFHLIAGRSIFFHWTAMLPLLAATAVMTYRLSLAYREYLGFPHAAAVAASSQLIVLLTLLSLAPWGWII
jgi:hypothetical protein